jgi:hypothetical protein
MSSSGLIYVAIVGAWAAYLVPRCLRRSDDRLPRGSADRSSAAARVLARRDRRYRPRDEGHYSLLRLPPAWRPAPVVKPRRATRPRYPKAYGPPYRPSPRSTQTAARAGARQVTAATLARRRRVLGFLALACAVAVTAGVGGWLPMWGGALPVLLLLTYATELRAGVRRRHAVGLRRRRGQAVADVRRRRIDFATRLEAVRRALRPAVPDEPTIVEPPVEVHDGWQPIEVPLPTYVTAPKAPIRVRTIDVSSPGAWASTDRVAVAEAKTTTADPEADAAAVRDTSADDTAEIPLVGPVAETAETTAGQGPESIEQPVERRAVND